MSDRNDVLTALADDLTVISGSSPYETDIKEIKRGINFVDDFDSMPALSFWCYQDEVVSRQMDGSILRFLHIYLYGYADSADDVHNFEDDIEYFLENDFTYKDDTVIKTDTPIIIYEGGAAESADNMALFRLDIKVKYEYSPFLVAEGGEYLIAE